MRTAALTPPRTTADLPPTGGHLRARPEDFQVEELPAYPPDNRPGHLLLTMQKRAFNSEDALRQIARHLALPRVELGLAGLKDRDALTRQRISVPAPDPAATLERLAQFHHPAITLDLDTAAPHSHKLRRGHLRGNRFLIVIRQPTCPLPDALTRAQAILTRLAADPQGGLPNLYGEQRFGRGGANLDNGLAALRGKSRGRRPKTADLIVSAGQSALFNLYLCTRAERGQLRTVLPGDVLQKRETGGLFVSEDPATDQRRLDAGELVITGPMVGSKTRAPGPDTPAETLERELLAAANIEPARLAKLGKRVPGTRRPLLIWPVLDGPPELAPPPDDAPELGPGVALRFCLPSGSYATVLLREIMGINMG
nr:tRNA pseudouridine(13) synthase TruD [Pseudenhygromyxa sp. WMMC2535]